MCVLCGSPVCVCVCVCVCSVTLCGSPVQWEFKYYSVCVWVFCYSLWRWYECVINQYVFCWCKEVVILLLTVLFRILLNNSNSNSSVFVLSIRKLTLILAWISLYIIWEVNIVGMIIYFIFNQIFITLDYLFRPYVLFVKLNVCILDYLLLHSLPWVT